MTRATDLRTEVAKLREMLTLYITPGNRQRLQTLISDLEAEILSLRNGNATDSSLVAAGVPSTPRT